MEVEEHLSSLDASGLIRKAQSEPDLEYLFRHVLTQEAAYNSLLRQDRRKLHLAVGEALERDYAHRLDEFAPILGRHFDEAGQDERALKYFIRAGDVAARRYANAEAVMHYTRALEIARGVKTSPADLTELYLKRGRLLEIGGRYIEALANYVEMEMEAKERDDQAMLLAELMARATIYAAPTTLNDPEHGDELAQRALALARERGDRAAEAKALWLRLLATRFTGQAQQALEYGEQAAAIARELNLRDQLAFVLNDMFPSYMATVQMPKARASLNEALQLWHELDNRNLLTDALNSAAELEFFGGNIGAAQAMLQESIRLGEDIGNVWAQSNSQWMAGEFCAHRGEYGAAIQAFEKSVRLGAQAGFVVSQISTRAYLAWVYAQLGAYEQGERVARESIQTAETLRPEWKGIGYAALAMCQAGGGILEQAEESIAIARATTNPFDMSVAFVGIVQSEMQLAQGEYQSVVAMGAEFLKQLRHFGVVIFEPDVRFYTGKAWLGLGRLDDAAAELGAAREQAQALGERRLLWRILLALAECEARRGRTDEAAKFRACADDEIAFITSHLNAPELRTSFRALASKAASGLWETSHGS